MKILKLLNKIFFKLIIIFFCISSASSEEKIDIWKIDNATEPEAEIQDVLGDNEIKNNVYENIGTIESTIREEVNDDSGNDYVYGLFDPEDNDLNIEMWINSDGQIVLEKLNKINNINLSAYAEDIFFKTLYTRSYAPIKNLDRDTFFEYKSRWLVKKKKILLIEEYLKKNANLKKKKNLIEFLINEHIVESNIDSACKILNLINNQDSSLYIDKFRIYCQINNKNLDIAQLHYDLLRESEYNDVFYDKKINFLLGYSDNIDNSVSDKDLLSFFLSHIVNSDFNYEPNKTTSKYIWRYLSSANLAYDSSTIDPENEDQINLIEKAVAEGSYDSKELFKIYKNILFNINQLLNFNNVYKTLPDYKARALLYQSILLTDNPSKKIELIIKLNNLFKKSNIDSAFEEEIKVILLGMDKDKLPDDYVRFYEYYLNNKDKEITKIKYNNSILHKSKLLKYFISDKYTLKNAEKDLEIIYKKIKKNKDYYFSTKDIIITEILKSEGLKIPKKIQKLYSLDNLTIPKTWSDLVKKKEEGLLLLNLVELIGEDNLSDLDSDTLYFVIVSLDNLKLKKIRNNIILNYFPERS